MIFLVLGCPKPEPVENQPEVIGAIEWGDEILCEGGTEGGERFTKVEPPDLMNILLGSAETTIGENIGGLTPLAVGDLDQDGLFELVVGNLYGTITVLHNDGNFVLTTSQILPAIPVLIPGGLAPSPLAMALVDRDGDGFPELWMSGFGWLAVWKNQDGVLSSIEVISDPTDPNAGFYSEFTLGDIDGDGTVDIAVSPLSPMDEVVATTSANDYPPPAATRIFYDREGSWVEQVLSSNLMAATMQRLTDRDGDGDLDWMVPGDRHYPLAFWRNDGNNSSDGLPVFVEEAGDIGMATQISGMGVAEADLNGDGILDYCMTDVGPPVCFLTAYEQYWSSASSIGLTVERGQDETKLSGWSLRIADLDNDGYPDAFQTSGAPVLPNEGEELGEEEELFENQVDVLWRGIGGGFEEQGYDPLISSIHDHYGSSLVDLNQDGALDMLVGGYHEPIHLYANRCTSGAWLEVDLAESGALALGARVEVQLGPKVWVQEASALSGPGQMPLRLHFGLGDVTEVDRVTVFWLNGTRSEATAVPVRRILTATAP